MLISRTQLFQFFNTFLMTRNQVNQNQNQHPPAIAKYHIPPPGNSPEYSTNPTPFGRILEGSLPAHVYRETENTLTFRNRTPRAPLHALVIPKKLIPSIKELSSNDLGLLHEMKREALDTIRNYSSFHSGTEKVEGNSSDLYMTKEESVLERGDYILCFHIPPFTSVDHLHLHVLAPKSEMDWIYRHGKYQIGTPWCTEFETVVRSLEKGG
eukprot:scaffold4487_cov273-Chaetoceros_neogracile.AAC.22